MHFNIFSEGICGKVGIFHNEKNPIEGFFFTLPLDVGDQPGLSFIVGAFSVIVKLREGSFSVLVFCVDA